MRILKIFILMVSIASFASDKNSQPEWMVKVVKNINGKKIEGTGYIVEIDGRKFIRTASHVVLGSTDNIELYSSNGNKVQFSKRNYITDNTNDDFLVEIQSDIDPLGKWNNGSGRFQVNAQTYKEFINSENNVYVEKRYDVNPKLSANFIKPLWSTRRASSQEYEVNLLNSVEASTIGTPTTLLTPSKIENINTSQVRLFPGESGSPLVSFDHEGEYAFIGGHALSTHKSLTFSNFLSNQSFSSLNDLYRQGVRGSLDNIFWKYENNQTYRVLGNIKETSFQLSNTGNGTGVDTGNGTGVDTGNGTGVDTGNGTGVDTGNTSQDDQLVNQMGMQFGDDQVLAFELNSDSVLCIEDNEIKSFLNNNGYVAANWLNYQFLEKLKLYSLNNEDFYKPVRVEKINEALITRLVDSKSVFKLPSWIKEGDLKNRVLAFNAYRKSCVIDEEELKQNKLKIEFTKMTNLGLEHNIFEKPLNGLNFLYNFELADGSKANIDLTSLFGVDISALSSESKLQNKVFIDIKIDGHKGSKLECSLLRTK